MGPLTASQYCWIWRWNAPCENQPSTLWSSQHTVQPLYRVTHTPPPLHAAQGARFIFFCSPSEKASLGSCSSKQASQSQPRTGWPQTQLHSTFPSQCFGHWLHDTLGCANASEVCWWSPWLQSAWGCPAWAQPRGDAGAYRDVLSELYL